MNRRQLLATAGCLLGPSVSGCLTDPGTNGGLLEVLLATAPSGATVTDASDQRVRTVDPLQDGLEQAATARTSVAEIELIKCEYDIVARTLSKRRYGTIPVSLRYDSSVATVGPQYAKKLVATDYRSASKSSSA